MTCGCAMWLFWIAVLVWRCWSGSVVIIVSVWLWLFWCDLVWFCSHDCIDVAILWLLCVGKFCLYGN